MLWSLRLSCSLALGCIASLFAQSGLIQGVVVDPSGQPVPRARIEIVPRAPQLSRAALYRDADSFGRFSFSPLRWDTYQIYAIGPRPRGVYDTWDFARGKSGPDVAVSPDTPEVQVTVNTGSEPGRLAPFSAVDASTGDLLVVTDPLSRDRMSRVSLTLMSPELGISISAPLISTTGGWREVLLPAEVPVTIKLSSPGYADWYYPGTADKSSARPIMVKAGGLFELGTVALTPKAQ
jgi:hypothetical protein